MCHIFCLLKKSKLVELVEMADVLLLVQNLELEMKITMGVIYLYL